MHHLMQFFSYEHLPTHLQKVSKPFADQAKFIEETMPDNPQKTMCLVKLLEAKDCAVRAYLFVEPEATI
jgi:ferritin-like protein